jgi:transcriptional pleiotropic regulator of transition state genes
MRISTAMIRPVDPLGRAVLPKELRDIMSINKRDSLEIFTDDDNSIILKKYNPGCLFCNSMDNLVKYKDRLVCKQCIAEINKDVQYPTI